MRRRQHRFHRDKPRARQPAAAGRRQRRPIRDQVDLSFPDGITFCPSMRKSSNLTVFSSKIICAFCPGPSFQDPSHRRCANQNRPAGCARPGHTIARQSRRPRPHPQPAVPPAQKSFAPTALLGTPAHHAAKPHPRPVGSAAHAGTPAMFGQVTQLNTATWTTDNDAVLTTNPINSSYRFSVTNNSNRQFYRV